MWDRVGEKEVHNIHLRSRHVVVAHVDSQVVGRVLIALQHVQTEPG